MSAVSVLAGKPVGSVICWTGFFGPFFMIVLMMSALLSLLFSDVDGSTIGGCGKALMFLQ
jgi:hypothetical protein